MFYKSNRLILKILLYSFAIFYLNTVIANDGLRLNAFPEGGRNEPFQAEFLRGSIFPDTGVILLHDSNSNHISGDIVYQLRIALHSAGYTTLSISTPSALADYDGTGSSQDLFDYQFDLQRDNFAFPEAYARIRTAESYLNAFQTNKVVFVGFGMGARFITAYLKHGPTDVNKSPRYQPLQVLGVIAVSMVIDGTPDPLNPLFTLPGISVPMLDIYSEEDTESLNTADRRTTAYGGPRNRYTSRKFVCGSNISLDDCRALGNNKSIDGTTCELLELTTIEWINRIAPLVRPDVNDNLGVCKSGLLTEKPAPKQSFVGAFSPLYFVLLTLLYFFSAGFLRKRKH